MRLLVALLRSTLLHGIPLSSADVDEYPWSRPASSNPSRSHFGDRAALIATPGNPFTVANSSDAVPHPRDFSMGGGDLACFHQQVSLRTQRSHINHATSLKILGNTSSNGARFAPLICPIPRLLSRSPIVRLHLTCAARIWFSRHCRRTAACAVMSASNLQEAVSCTH